MLQFLLSTILAFPAFADEPPKLPVSWGAFVDTYYAYDLDDPPGHERAFVTQAKRSNEFNVNLAFAEAKIAADRVRGRLALQAGTSVQANYAAEPSVGATSGPSLSRTLQEAYVGYRLAEGLWIDGGIYFSHLGFEGWISRDNWNYTRSLDAELTPYYQSGVKLSYAPGGPFSAQLHLLNGWQNISENNEGKAIGAQVNFAPNNNWSLTYNNFYGSEADSSGRISPRFFNQLIGRVSVSGALQFALTLDEGAQKRPGGGSAGWSCETLLARYQLANTVFLGARGEHYGDPSQVIVATGSPNGFAVWGASLNVDVVPLPYLLWRTELRELWARDPVFPGRNGPKRVDPLAVTSLALTI